jgi:hypothetical protein
MNRKSFMVQNNLTDLSPVFSQTAIECVKGMFGKSCEIKMPWEVVAQLQGQFDRILAMGSSSKRFRAITSAGIQDDSLCAFLGQENVSADYASDVLGEFVNTYTGMLSDNEKFRECFGTLEQAVPVLYTNGHSYLPFIWGIQGYIYIGIHWVYIGYSIRENTPAM